MIKKMSLALPALVLAMHVSGAPAQNQNVQTQNTSVNKSTTTTFSSQSSGSQPEETTVEKTVTTTTEAKHQSSVTPAPAPEKPQDDQYVTPPLGMFRGISNVATCWLELPRCIVYDNAQVPIFGIVAGTGEGVCLTVYRALTAVIDIASFGTAGNYIYTKKYPGWFWDLKWLPPAPKE